MRAVLDTNVWLDWLVFDDPATRRLAQLAAGPHDGTLRLLATEAMLAETDQVLARPWFALAQDRRRALLARQRSLVELCEPAPDCRLACSDSDDQMFIDLAVARRVDWLISRDKALLRLRRHALRRFGLRIATPAQWRDQLAPDGVTPDGVIIARGSATTDAAAAAGDEAFGPPGDL